MLKKIAMLAAVATLTANLAWGAAIGGRVVANDGEKVTVKLAKVPAWIKTGAVLSAIGGKPTVVEVKGTEVVLRFSKAKAAKLKVETNLTLNELKTGGGAQLQGC